MAQDMEGSYAALKSMAENTPSINKKIVGEKEMNKARALLREYNERGWRIDGAPATASIYGVLPRKTTPAPMPAPTPSEPSKEEMKAALLAELAAYRKEQEERANAERNAEAVDRGEPEERAGAPDKEASADGVRPETAGRDRECGYEDRGTAQETAGSGREGESRPKARARVKEKRIGEQGVRGPNKTAPELTQEQETEIYEEYAAGATIPQLREKHSLSRHYIEAAIEAEGRRRGEDIFRKHASPTKPDLSAQSRAALFDQYAAGETAVVLAERFGINRYHTEKIIKAEAERRGVEKPAHIGSREPRLNPEQQAEFYREYATTAVSVEELARKWQIGEGTAWRYIQKARLNGDEAEKNKPRKERKSRRMVQLPEEQVRELGRRRDLGESTEDLAKEIGVTRYALRNELRRVCGKSKYGHNTLTAEDRAELVRKYKNGVRYRELSRLYHISSQTITKILDEAGVAQRGENPRRGIMTESVAARIEFPAIGRWMDEQGMSMYAMAEKLGTTVPTAYRWLTGGGSEFMTKRAIDTLMDLTGLSYPELFARENVGGVKPPRAELERQLETARKALAAFMEWIERMEKDADDVDGN